VPDGSVWQRAEIVSKVLHAEAVVYSYMLETAEWKLHSIQLSENIEATEVLGRWEKKK
jgi:hypothetical protein